MLHFKGEGRGRRKEELILTAIQFIQRQDYSIKKHFHEKKWNGPQRTYRRYSDAPASTVHLPSSAEASRGPLEKVRLVVALHSPVTLNAAALSLLSAFISLRSISLSLHFLNRKMIVHTSHLAILLEVQNNEAYLEALGLKIPLGRASAVNGDPVVGCLPFLAGMLLPSSAPLAGDMVSEPRCALPLYTMPVISPLRLCSGDSAEALVKKCVIWRLAWKRAWWGAIGDAAPSYLARCVFHRFNPNALH